jgi:hypothetical protein
MNKFMLGCEEGEQGCEQSERRAGALEGHMIIDTRSPVF